MINLKNSLKILFPADKLVICFSFVVIIISLVFSARVDSWFSNIMLSILLIIAAVVIARFDFNTSSLLSRGIHYLYLTVVVLAAFKLLYTIVDPVRGLIVDSHLINIDRFIFGADPTHLLWKISHPALTELLQISYSTFFFLPIILGISLIRKGEFEEIDYGAFIILFGFWLSYIGYLLFPAIGPRFTLHSFEMTNSELPGIFLTDLLREIINSGESIPAGTANPALVVQRDAFPSGHTQMTLLTIYLSVKFRSPVKWFMIINGTLLIFATVYLRYHYVVDLIGGIIFMIMTLYIGKYLYQKWSVSLRPLHPPGSQNR